MAEWHLKNHELKRYPHFDAVISASAAVKYATDRDAVANHSFFPFLRFKQRWTSFAEKGDLGKSKDRELRYAARRDAYIFAYYRSILTAAYEHELKQHNLQDTVLAYRRIIETGGKSGKCNIHFARDAFLDIRKMGDCCAIALDISKFFEHLDHELLRKLWCRLLQVPKLPPDHFAVFRAITRYSIVDKIKAYERLGHYGPKRKTHRGLVLSGYLTAFDKIPKQLCSGSDFRNKIAGGNGAKSIIEKHYKPYGIPQGAPISDLLANLYLLDFDILVSAKVAALGGRYYRYSDDIFVVIPGDEKPALQMEADIRELISKFGAKLEIKSEKSAIVAYSKSEIGQTCQVVIGGSTYNQGIEYLGFRFDGKNAFIRNKTIQNLYRKMTRAARRDANILARRYPNKGSATLQKECNREEFIKRFNKVEDFAEKQDNHKLWTFWTYANRAAKIFGVMGNPIRRQLRKMKDIANHKIDAEIASAVSRRDNPKRHKTVLLSKP